MIPLKNHISKAQAFVFIVFIRLPVRGIVGAVPNRHHRGTPANWQAV